MKGLKPAVGREGLKAYDPEAFKLLDDFYSGRLEEPVVEAGFSGRSLKEEAGMPGLFKPDWASLKAHQDPEWFRDAKFGIYTHWGPVTVGCEDAPQGGEWYGREMYLTNNPIFAYHKQRFGDQHTFGYKQVIPLFTARKFDPEKWADLFARAGAKFAGPVAVHHDNFAMWASAVTPWNSVKMGPKRDITGELAKAYRERGLKLITTFHHGFAWRYYEPAFQFDAADGRDFELYTEPHGPKDPPSWRYQEQWLAMVMEVVRQYEPDMIWFDFELNEVITPEYQRRMFADYYNWAATHGTLGWPQGEFTLHSVRAESDSADARVELLGHGPVPHRLNAESQIVIQPPALALAQLPCQYAFSFKLTGFKTSVHPSNQFE